MRGRSGATIPAFAMNAVLAGILVYVALQLAVGVIVGRRVDSEDDYLLAGRRLGPTLATVSIFATWFGAETCVGASGDVFVNGLGAQTVEPFAYGICLLLMGVLLAAPLWRSGVTTLSDLLRARYGPTVERVAAVVLIPTSVLWAAAQIRAFGHVLASAGGIDPAAAIAIAACIAILYTVLGGLLADVVTDVVQGGALVVGLVIVAVATVADAGGVPAAFELLATAPPAEPAAAPGRLALVEAWALPILGSITAQEVVSRSLASRSARVARHAALAGGLLYLAVGTIPVVLGLLAVHTLDAPPADPDQILVTLAREQLPSFAFVLFAGALVSAILSTVDSALLAAGALTARNLLPRRGRADRGEGLRLRKARAAVLVSGVAAWWLASGADSVLELIEAASGFGSAGVLVVVCMALFSRIGGSIAATAALCAGAVTWIVGSQAVEQVPLPFLTSLAAAVLGYAGGALLDARRTAT